MGLAASPSLRRPPHCLTPFSELPAARGAAFVRPLPVKAASWPSEESHIPQPGTQDRLQSGPVPAPAVSPIIPLHPLLPYILSVLDVLTLSLPRTYADALPLPWKGLLPHLHLANAQLPLKAHFKCDLFLRPFIFHPNLIWPLSPLLAIIFSSITFMLYFWNANSFYSTLSSAREKSVSYPLST